MTSRELGQLSQKLNRVSRLLHRLQSPGRDASFDDTDAANLHATLEELRVTEERLLQENQRLSDALLAVEAERKRYADLFDLAPNGYLVTNEAGTILEANKAMGLMLGLDVASIANEPITMLLPVDERPAFREFLLKVRSEAAALDHPTVWQKDISMGFKTNTPVQARCSISSAEGSSDNVIRWSFRDLTEHKRAEEAIKRANQSLKTSVHDRTVQLEDKILELESFHDAVVGRELRLAELEQEIERFRQRLSAYEQLEH
jgi:PAS domain S-box-containing protein